MDVFGHDQIVKLLQSHIARQEVRHAYLFTGPDGVGRRTLAVRFAMALNCSQSEKPGIPCGTCRICRQTSAMQHADLSVVAAESQGGILKVDQIRELLHMVSLSPYEARWRVALLLRFEEANDSAQNALLKTLEEAPTQLVLLLTTTSAESLLPTIVSRCEVMRLRPAPVPVMEQALKERWQVPFEQAKLLAHVSGGKVGKALRMLEDPDLLKQRNVSLDDLKDLLRSNRRTRFAFAEKYGRQRDRSLARDSLRTIYQTWLTFWRDMLLVSTGSSVPLVNIDHKEEISRLAAHLERSMIFKQVVELQRAAGNLDANMNVQLLTEVLLLGWPRI